MSNRNGRYVSDVQWAYARVLQLFVIIGLAMLFVTFVLFASGALPELVSAERVPQLWDQGVESFIAETGFPQGWAWLKMLHYGDILTLGALAFLAAGTIVCFTIATVLFIRKRDWAFAAMVAVQVLVLVIAASGVASGH